MDPVVRLPLTSCDSRFDVDPTKLHAWTRANVAASGGGSRQPVVASAIVECHVTLGVSVTSPAVRARTTASVLEVVPSLR